MSTPVASLASLHNVKVRYDAVAALQPAVGQPAQRSAWMHIAMPPAVTAVAPEWRGAVCAKWAEVA